MLDINIKKKIRSFLPSSIYFVDVFSSVWLLDFADAHNLHLFSTILEKICKAFHYVHKKQGSALERTNIVFGIVCMLSYPNDIIAIQEKSHTNI